MTTNPEQKYPVTCPTCKREWTHSTEAAYEVQCPECALAELEADCRKQREAQIEADKREERTAEGDGCCGAVVATLASCGAIVWGVLKLARWC